MKISEERVKELMDTYDKTGDGTLQLDEFVTAVDEFPQDFFTGYPSTQDLKQESLINFQAGHKQQHLTDQLLLSINLMIYGCGPNGREV